MSTSEQSIDFNLKEYPTLKSFTLGEELVKLVIGPAGSAKTSYCMVYALARAIQQAPAPDGVRYYKAIVIRNTYQMLISNTLVTAKTMLGAVVGFRGTQRPVGTARFSLEDGTQVQFDMEFWALDSEDAQRKLLGAEPSLFILDEVTEMPESLIHACVRRLGRYPSAKLGGCTRSEVVGATNGPKKSHWSYQYHMGKRDDDPAIAAIERETGRKYLKIYQQPPALLRTHDKTGNETWEPNPEAENIKNLEGGYAYYFKMLGDPDDAKIKAYVEGKFSDIVTGKVVFPQFRSSLHAIDEAEVGRIRNQPIMLSFDFGRTPVCLIATSTPGGRVVVVDEVCQEDISIDGLCREYLRPALAKRFQGCTIEDAWGDPAGMSKSQVVEMSQFDVLYNHGIPVRNPGTNKLEPRLEVVRQYLQQLDSEGRPMLQISTRCTNLLSSISEGYVYELKRGGGGEVNDVPTKSHVNFVSDVADALQYLLLGYNRKYKRTRRLARPAQKPNFHV